ncbi:regulatory protein GemA [Verminephrobacter aporrectodeae subsp. tuberculatae]|uniref:gp16 family protein n=1 Tax=Verminephrobacter aporrectodeae TaxID=1110389 RepID=UPI002237C74D|nr:regulatory protein GemA [Verminephrobacter aporrectodeae]MCW5223492.1 regulatory protein GemA [Verminephrobacter aporrectodeae subsp. tuberculatae]MCW5288956.1 regulatory protein GemA [Verminephrobacter aporrectodeae subsp. tuberculatae]
MKPVAAQDSRRRELAQIHVALQQLGISDEDHRCLLWSVCQVRSAADLDWTGRRRYLEHLKKLGFKPRPKATKPGQEGPQGPGRGHVPRALAQDAQSRKIRALWLLLHQLAAVRNPSEASLAAYVKRITRVDALQWISGEQAETLIETLKKWAMRYLPLAVKELMSQVNALQLSDIDRGQLDAVLHKAFTHQTFDPMHSAWESLNDVLKRGR